MTTSVDLMIRVLRTPQLVGDPIDVVLTASMAEEIAQALESAQA